MSRESRRAPDRGEGESYYISMTDMMTGVVFVFIILLGYFATQFHSTTESLLRAGDPKTELLLQSATRLETTTVPARIDYAQRVVCLPTPALRIAAEPGAPPQDERCFSYADAKPTDTEAQSKAIEQKRSTATQRLAASAGAPAAALDVQPREGTLRFDASVLFLPGTDRLSATGETISAQVAQGLMELLPCSGYVEGVEPRACGADAERVGSVTVLAETAVDAFSAEGQAASGLALRRSVAFHRALTAAQPQLGRIQDRAPSAGGAPTRPLLRVASFARSDQTQTTFGANGAIVVQIDIVG